MKKQAASENLETAGKSPLVAIVGRPNVGKSALFNRVVGARIAIVHSESGVTRDRLLAEVTWGERRFQLCDTGGIGIPGGKGPGSQIELGIRGQVEVALKEAAAAILVTDIEAGIQPADEEVAGLLHKSGLKVFVAANKADGPQRDGNAADMERLGFPAFPVSAVHGRGVVRLMEKVVACIPETACATVANPLRVVVVGRPNVGKSSYINRLLREERVLVADVPGTTRDSVEIPFAVGTGPGARNYLLIDTAGIRRRGKIDSAVETFSLMRAERSIESADVAVLITDAVQGVTAQDKKIAAKILEHKRGCVLVVNKWDLSEKTQRAYAVDLKHMLAMMDFVPVVFISSKTGYNIRNTVECIDHVASQVSAQLPTGVLNRVLNKAYERVQPPLVHGQRLKFFYATQTGMRPLKIVLFVNDPKRVTPAYKSYLEGKLRAAFGLEGAPLVLWLRARTGTRAARMH